MKHLHVPLGDELHQALMTEAQRSGESATSIARHAIELALRARRQEARRHAIAAYATAHAGTKHDLDPELEDAALEGWS